MSKALKIVLNSMSNNYYWNQENLEDYSDSLIDYESRHIQQIIF